jgi:hypothetical protein
MCQNAVKNVAALLAAEEPSIKSLLAATGQTSTPLGLSIIASYNAALTALQSWVPGTPAQDALQAVTDLQIAFNGLSPLLPANLVLFANIVLGGIEAVIGILVGNSPAPAPVVDPGQPAIVPHENTQAAHEAATAIDTATKVQALVPGFKMSIFHTPQVQYVKTWNDAVQANPTAGMTKI